MISLTVHSAMRGSPNSPSIMAPISSFSASVMRSLWCCLPRCSGIFLPDEKRMRISEIGSSWIGATVPLVQSPELLTPSAFQVVQKRIHHLCSCVVCHAGGLTLHVAHQAFEIIAGIRDADHAQRGSLPQVGCVNLRHRDVERIAQAIFDTAHHLALVFERVRGLNTKFEVR